MRKQHQTTAVPKLLYTTAEAKAAIGCGTTKLYELLASGRLEARRLGRRTYITAESLDALVEGLARVVTPKMQKRAAERHSDHAG